jgi:NADH-quinone oxidoreductase subunit G
VFTDKTLKEHYTRKWDLTTAPSVCQHCSVGCNIIAGERYGEVRCVLNRYNGEVNGYFLCDRGRFGYEFVNSENRVKQPVVRDFVSEAVNEAGLMKYLKTILTQQKLIGIGSPRASVESNFALQQLVGEENFYGGVNETETYLTRRIVNALQAGAVHSASLKDIELADAVLILGEDIWNTAPMMALAVRQSVMKTAAADAVQHVSLPVWHDAAVKELVQEEKGFLSNITVVGSSLDDITTCKLCAAPDDIARLGFAIAHELNAALPTVNNADETMLNNTKTIATALQHAKRPVIISGISCCNEGILKAAFDIAAALNTTGRKAGMAFALRECNSMGLAMMQAPSFDKAIERLQKEADVTAIIIENDVYGYTPPLLADSFFSRCKNIIALDSLNNATTEKANVLIPVATFAEADGTLVNYEGRAQRFYQVFIPAGNEIKESWKWLWRMQLAKTQTTNGNDLHHEELLEKLETSLSQFKGITGTSPKRDYTLHGERIPREPHRYSGRTAMTANLDVSEPKPLQDDDSPLSFTMEGYKGIPPSGMTPFFWSPGWNSVQSVAKFQNEPGGALKDGDPGVKLFKDKSGEAPIYFKDVPEAFVVRQQKWLVLPQYDALGSGKLSSYTKAVKELSPRPFIMLSEHDAAQLNVGEDAVVKIFTGENEYLLPVKIKKELVNGIAMVSAELQGINGITWGEWMKIARGK